jgi:SDR family mycofactocin-dependent oxidoreductase
MDLLAGKTALITGAGRGMGRAQALRLAREGAAIVAVDRGDVEDGSPYELATGADLAETVEAVKALGGEAIAATADVRSSEQLDAALRAGLDAFGSVDICAANAGVMSAAPFWELADDEWTRVIDVNLGGVWRTAKAVAPAMMRARSGSIVFTASVAAFEASSGLVHYSAAKHGVLGVMRTVALELAPYGVRCNAVCPGATDTGMVNWQGMYDRFAGHAGGTRADMERRLRNYGALAPAAMLTGDDIANAVLWLASDLSARVTGTAIPVDSGHLLLPHAAPTA